MDSDRVTIKKLPGTAWQAARGLRLEALRTDPGAFGSSYEEEVGMAEGEWRKRMKNTLYAVSGGKPVGMISRVFSDRVKTRHIAAIYGFYVTPGQRGKGVGRLLMKRALDDVERRKVIVKVELSVNPKFLSAVRIYRESGFEVTGTLKNELRVGRVYFDMLNMEKQIRRP